MQILFLTPFYKPAYLYGGPVNSISTLCEALAKLGEQVTVFTTNANGAGALEVPVDRPVDVNGVQVHYFERHPLSPRRYFMAPAMGRALTNRIRDFDVAYTCVTWTYPMLAFSRARSRKAIPYVLSPRGDFMNWSMKQGFMKKLAYLAVVEKNNVDRASAIHCTSQAEVQQLERWRFRPLPVLIPNGMNMSRFEDLPERGRLRERLHIPNEAPVTLFAGRIHAMKRVDRTIRIFSEVVRSIPEAHLVIAGHDEDGSGRDALWLANNLGLGQNVHFTGPLAGADLLQAYSDSDSLVLLSHRENFGMVVLEAMACRLPVLVSGEVGLGDAVAEAGAGLAVNPDAPECASAWIWLLSNPPERQAMGQKAFRLALDRFSIDGVSRRMRNLFYQVA